MHIDKKAHVRLKKYLIETTMMVNRIHAHEDTI